MDESRDETNEYCITHIRVYFFKFYICLKFSINKNFKKLTILSNISNLHEMYNMNDFILQRFRALKL